ncbi:hypothetical protein D3C81_1432360 [compost metagenome]
MNDHGGRFGQPGQGKTCLRVWAAVHVGTCLVEQGIEHLIVNEIAGHRLQQDAFRQAHAAFVEEPGRGCDFAAADAAEVADRAFDFRDATLPELLLQLFEGGIHANLGKVIGSFLKRSRERRSRGSEHQAGGMSTNVLTQRNMQLFDV